MVADPETTSGRVTFVSTLVVVVILLVATVPVSASQSTSTSNDGSIAGADTITPAPDDGHRCSDMDKITVNEIEVTDYEDENERLRDRKRITVSATGNPYSYQEGGHRHEVTFNEVGFDISRGIVFLETKSGKVPFPKDMEMNDDSSEFVFYFQDPGRYEITEIWLGMAQRVTHLNGGPGHPEVENPSDACVVPYNPPLTVEVGHCQAEKTSLILNHEKLRALATKIDTNHRAADAAMENYYEGKNMIDAGENLMAVGSSIPPEEGGTDLFLAGSKMSVAGTTKKNLADSQFQNALIAESRASQKYIESLVQYKSARRYVQNCHNYEVSDDVQSPPRPETWEQEDD